MLGNEARGLGLFRSGKRNVACGHFEAPNAFQRNAKVVNMVGNGFRKSEMVEKGLK